MRFERHFTISLETFNSFYSFIEEQKKKYHDEQLIGYEAHRNDLNRTVEVILTFAKNEKKEQKSIKSFFEKKLKLY